MFSPDFVCNAVMLAEVATNRTAKPWDVSFSMDCVHSLRLMGAALLSSSWVSGGLQGVGETIPLSIEEGKKKKNQTHIVLVLAITGFLSDHKPISYQQLDSFPFFFLSFFSPLSEPILSHQNLQTDGQLQRKFPWELSRSLK